MIPKRLVMTPQDAAEVIIRRYPPQHVQREMHAWLAQAIEDSPIIVVLIPEATGAPHGTEIVAP